MLQLEFVNCQSWVVNGVKDEDGNVVRRIQKRLDIQEEGTVNIELL